MTALEAEVEVEVEQAFHACWTTGLMVVRAATEAVFARGG